MTANHDKTPRTSKSIDDSNQRQRDREPMITERTGAESSSEQAEKEQERQLETGEESPS